MIEALKKDVIHKLKDDQDRLKHTLGVYETAIKLAKHYQLDVFKISVASLYHDYTKNDDLSIQKKLLTKTEIKTYEKYPVMYHALSAAKQLTQTYDIHDQDILLAITSHIWGRPQMSIYEKVVFVSDYADPNRKYFDPNIVYELAVKDLDQAVLYCIELTLGYLRKLDIKPSQEQLETYHYYKEVNSGKTKQDY